ncbi:DUF3037 domain-containing protein [Saccharospirillum salsuginis]|uniref:DUF3037 domain-containing protein n=1 Tax=Saccharospirillum salsuginis TaxID=418750 RepID=A0A918KMP7_9GAMM|nr:DUF3037 domain-containing protein [Saccharospirillum salsuginis]GGX69011.1 hypothetical protein GCM10007392_40860 [Saccharospirillum salsuginis]
MTKQACRYAVVRFVPYPESEEFANIGIVMAVPKSNRFLFRLEINDVRYSRFFKNLPKGLYKQLAKDLESEYTAIQRLVSTNKANALQAFERLVVPRSNIVAFGGQRTLLLQNQPEKKLDRLFDHYVHHAFTRKEGHETRLKRQVRQVIDDLRLERPFRPHTFKLYEGELPVQVDLAQVVDEKVIKVIKPFYFDLTTKEGLWDHADKWIPKLVRLKRAGELPERTLLPLDHSSGNQRQLDALEDIKRELADLGTVIRAEEHDKIRSFALDS